MRFAMPFASKFLVDLAISTYYDSFEEEEYACMISILKNLLNFKQSLKDISFFNTKYLTRAIS